MSIKQSGNALRVEIRDWGIGFDLQKVDPGCFGLRGIRERARLLGGKCSIRSKPGRGTIVVVAVPVIMPEEEL